MTTSLSQTRLRRLISALILSQMSLISAPGAVYAHEFEVIEQGLTLGETLWDHERLFYCFRPRNFVVEGRSADTVEFLSQADYDAARTRAERAVAGSWARVSALDIRGSGTCTERLADIVIRFDDSIERANAVVGPAIDGRSYMALKSSSNTETIVHEFGHSLGFAHEQDRHDVPANCL